MGLDGAGIILHMTKNMILLVYDKRSHKWSFPKGRCEIGETLLQTAVREMMEETGIEVNVAKDTQAITFHKKNATRCYFICNLSNIPNSQIYRAFRPTVPTDTVEIGNIKWFSREQLVSMNRCNVNYDVWQWIHYSENVQLVDGNKITKKRKNNSKRRGRKKNRYDLNRKIESTKPIEMNNYHHPPLVIRHQSFSLIPGEVPTSQNLLSSLHQQAETPCCTNTLEDQRDKRSFECRDVERYKPPDLLTSNVQVST